LQEKTFSLSRDELQSAIHKCILIHPELLEQLDVLNMQQQSAKSSSVSQSCAEHDPTEPRSSGSGQPQWCNCGRCRPMESNEANVCCRKNLRPGRCITEVRRELFARILLDADVLRLILMDHNDLFANGDEPINTNMRYTAYRQFILWRYGYLGQGNRMVVPSCLTWAIRNMFPEQNGQYTGYRPSRLN